MSAPKTSETNTPMMPPPAKVEKTKTQTSATIPLFQALNIDAENERKQIAATQLLLRNAWECEPNLFGNNNNGQEDNNNLPQQIPESAIDNLFPIQIKHKKIRVKLSSFKRRSSLS